MVNLISFPSQSLDVLQCLVIVWSLSIYTLVNTYLLDRHVLRTDVPNGLTGHYPAAKLTRAAPVTQF